MLKLNIGCGPNGQVEGFINIDNSKAVFLAKFPKIKKLLFQMRLISQKKLEHDWTGVRWMDASRRLPFVSESVDKIYCSHFLEHIPLDKGKHVLKDCHRILKKGGVMRLVVPDLLWYAEKYVDQTKELLKNPELVQNREVHDKFLNSLYGAYLNKNRYGLNHCYMYDLPTLVAVLKSVGFQNIHKCEFKEGIDNELPSYDSRPIGSLHLEIRK